MVRILVASLLGALLCVAWGAVSWMVLQWHGTVLHQFNDEAAVAAVLKANVTDELNRREERSGVFILPGNAMSAPGQSDSGSAAMTKPSADPKMFVYAVVRPGAPDMNMGLNMAYAFARSFAACLMISLMLSWTIRLDYLQRVLFCVLGGLFAGAVTDVPMMIWFAAPLRYTFISFADHLCEWFIAGLAIAAFVQGREIWERFR